MNLKLIILIFKCALTSSQIWPGDRCIDDQACMAWKDTWRCGKSGKCYDSSKVVGHKTKDSSDCFPGISEVLTEGNERIKMEDIQVGDFILTLQDGTLEPTKVLGFFKKYVNRTGNEYLNMTLESGGSLRISESHIVFVLEEDNVLKSIMGKDIRTGDKLVVPDKESMKTSRVVKIEKEDMVGIYAPLTSAGTLIVDNVWCSCYADVIAPHWLVQIGMAPLRWWPETLLEDVNSQAREGLRPLPGFLRRLGRMIGVCPSKETFEDEKMMEMTDDSPDILKIFTGIFGQNTEL